MVQALLFPGQGAQVIGMGMEFYHKSDEVKKYFRLAEDSLGFPLSKICFEGPEAVLKETRVCQPALYVVSYSIFACLRAKNCLKQLRCVLGLSLGELTALAAAEVFSFETGLRLVAERGRLMQEACEAAQTGMVSLIGGTLEWVKTLCEKHDIDLANLNCPGQAVVAGPLDRLENAMTEAKAMGFKLVVPLKVAGAYHSRWMQGARDKFEHFLAPFHFERPTITVLSNTCGSPLEEPEEIKKALGVQITATVRLEECLRWLMAKELSDCYECGPGNVLAGLAKRTSNTLRVRPLSEWKHLNDQ